MKFTSKLLPVGLNTQSSVSRTREPMIRPGTFSVTLHHTEVRGVSFLALLRDKRTVGRALRAVYSEEGTLGLLGAYSEMNLDRRIELFVGLSLQLPSFFE